MERTKVLKYSPKYHTKNGISVKLLELIKSTF